MVLIFNMLGSMQNAYFYNVSKKNRLQKKSIERGVITIKPHCALKDKKMVLVLR